MKLKLVLIIALASCAAAPICAQARDRGGSGSLSVNCNATQTIGAAINSLKTRGSTGPNMITVSGACHENVVIQSMDRLTLNAAAGASITDASGGSAEVIEVTDSRSVSINNFTIHGGGIDCSDGSLCRLNGNTILDADVGVGVSMSQAVVTGGSVQGATFAAINVSDGSSVEVTGVMIVNNPGNGIQIQGQSLVVTDSTIATNGGAGAFISHNGFLRCLGCQITGNGVEGVILRRESSAKFQRAFTVTGNAGGGVLLTESSSAYFAGLGTVTGNPGGMDVVCSSSFTTARGVTSNIGGGTTNCTEPPQ